MKSKVFEYMVEEKFSDSCGVYSFCTRDENYPLCKAMVDHDHQRVMSIRWGKVHDEIHRELFERQRGGGWDRSEWGTSRVVIDFVLLAYSASGNEGIDERGQSGPPKVPLQKCFCAESSCVS